jgi:DMSO/TMAO reductase YedYZ molybdopterin-dependent catalytic subunit
MGSFSNGLSRRRLLCVGGLAIAGGGAAALLSEKLGLLEKNTGRGAPDPLAGALPRGTLPFDFGDQPAPPSGVLLGAGLDARLFTDLSMLEPDGLITPNDRFFIRTACPSPLPPTDGWTIRAGGLLGKEAKIRVDDLRTKATSMGVHLFECAGNSNPRNFGLLSAAAWAGVPLKRVLQALEILPRVKRVLVSGFDRHAEETRDSVPGASWIFGLDELIDSGAFLATGMNGAELPRDHGFPVRLVVPGWYGCTCIKWVDEILLLDDDAPATNHMLEFAKRTMQSGRPKLAREFKPARVDPAALPVRIEKWSTAEGACYRIVGIVWGGDKPDLRLMIRFHPDEDYRPVTQCAPRSSASTWGLWSHVWKPGAPGRYRIALRVDDPSVQTRRLDAAFYARDVRVTEV